MKHFFTTKVKTVLIIAVLLAAGLAVISNLTGSTFADTLVQSVLAPLRSGVNSLALQAERIYDYIFQYETLETENADHGAGHFPAAGYTGSGGAGGVYRA